MMATYAQCNQETVEMHGMCSADYFVPIYQINTHGDLAGVDLDRIWRWRKGASLTSHRWPAGSGGVVLAGVVDAARRHRAGFVSHRRPAGSGGTLLAGVHTSRPDVDRLKEDAPWRRQSHTCVRRSDTR
jgi:hypothetical protein